MRSAEILNGKGCARDDNERFGRYLRPFTVERQRE